MRAEYSIILTILDVRLIFILSSTLDEYLQVRIRARDIQYSVDPRDTDHKDLEHIDFSVPRRAQYVHSAWKRHQDAVFWFDIDLSIQKGLTF